MSQARSRCVLLFSRAPRAEACAKHVRSAEPLFALAGRRVAEAVAALPGVDLVVVGPSPGGETLSSPTGLAQRGRGFAERLGNAFADARALGYREIVAVPGDLPGLSAAHLAAAFQALADRAIVLGPSPDGGVYLIGTAEPAEGLLSGVRWRTRHVLADLLARAGDARLLERLADLDRPADLARLERQRLPDRELRAVLLAIRRPVLPRAIPAGGRPRAQLLAPPDAQRGPPAAA